MLKAANQAAEERSAAAQAELRAARPKSAKELDGLSTELVIAHEVCMYIYIQRGSLIIIRIN